jgi:hypothetical protein
LHALSRRDPAGCRGGGAGDPASSAVPPVRAVRLQLEGAVPRPPRRSASCPWRGAGAADVPHEAHLSDVCVGGDKFCDECVWG